MGKYLASMGKPRGKRQGDEGLVALERQSVTTLERVRGVAHRLCTWGTHTAIARMGYAHEQ